jgi:hypothetical protein
MEYIEFKNGLYHACSGEVVIDNHVYFDSRANYHGFKGPSVSFEVNGYRISWKTNFGFGRYHQGTVCILLDGILLIEYDNILSTKDFVEILNKFTTGEINAITIMKNLACYSNEYRDLLIDYDKNKTLKFYKQSWLSMDITTDVKCETNKIKTRHDYWLKYLKGLLEKENYN